MGQRFSITQSRGQRNSADRFNITLDDLPPQEFKITDWQPCEKNTLRSVFTLITPSGYVFRGRMLHEKSGSRWVGLPAQKYAKAGVGFGYKRIVEFTSREVSERFQAGVLRAIDLQVAGGAR